MFTIHEQLIGDNQYRCSSCSNKLCDAEKVYCIKEKDLLRIFLYFRHQSIEHFISYAETQFWSWSFIIIVLKFTKLLLLLLPLAAW